MRPWFTLLVAALPSVLVPSTPAVAVDLCYRVTITGSVAGSFTSPLVCVPFGGPVECRSVTPSVEALDAALGVVVLYICRPR